MVAPSAPAPAPSMNPARRPKRAMKAESGVAESIEPSTISEIGRVARQALGASESPARPPRVKIIGICAPSTAWAKTSTATLRSVFASGRPDSRGALS